MFGSLYSNISGTFDGYITMFNLALIVPIIAILRGVTALYICYQGYLIYAGRSQKPIHDLLWFTGKITFIIITIHAVCDKSSIFSVYVVADEVMTWAEHVGATSIPQVLGTCDLIATELGLIMGTLISTTADKNSMIGAMQEVTLMAAGGGVIFVVEMGLLVAHISLVMCISVAPVFLASYLFGWSLPMFNSWLKLLIASVFTMVMMMMVVGNLLVSLVGVTAATGIALKADGNPMMIITGYAVFAAALIMIFKLAISFGEQLAGIAVVGAAVSGMESNANSATQSAARGMSDGRMSQSSLAQLHSSKSTSHSAGGAENTNTMGSKIEKLTDNKKALGTSGSNSQSSYPIGNSNSNGGSNSQSSYPIGNSNSNGEANSQSSYPIGNNAGVGSSVSANNPSSTRSSTAENRLNTADANSSSYSGASERVATNYASSTANDNRARIANDMAIDGKYRRQNNTET